MEYLRYHEFIRIRIRGHIRPPCGLLRTGRAPGGLGHYGVVGTLSCRASEPVGEASPGYWVRGLGQVFLGGALGTLDCRPKTRTPIVQEPSNTRRVGWVLLFGNSLEM